MKIGLIDVDSQNWPNLALMKLSAYHKARGETVDWYRPLLDGRLDACYLSKVFSWSSDYETAINAKHGYGWDTNPWVWVYTFERVAQEVKGDD